MRTDKHNVVKVIYRRARKALCGRSHAEEFEEDHDIELNGNVHGTRRDWDKEDQKSRWQKHTAGLITVTP